MKTLPPIKPTAEQLPLISDNNLGIEVRGWLREFEIEGVEVRVEPQKFEGAPN